jgi:hypothetical protein
MSRKTLVLGVPAEIRTKNPRIQVSSVTAGATSRSVALKPLVTVDAVCCLVNVIDTWCASCQLEADNGVNRWPKSVTQSVGEGGGGRLDSTVVLPLIYQSQEPPADHHSHLINTGPVITPSSRPGPPNNINRCDPTRKILARTEYGASTVHSCWLQAGWPENRGSIPGRHSSLPSPALGITQLRIRWVRGIKTSWRETDNKHPSKVDFKNMWSYT